MGFAKLRAGYLLELRGAHDKKRLPAHRSPPIRLPASDVIQLFGPAYPQVKGGAKSACMYRVYREANLRTRDSLEKSRRVSKVTPEVTPSPGAGATGHQSPP